MKRCPQCNSVFDDSLDYCTNDGSSLIKETFVLPSEASQIGTEEETVIRHEPITIDIPNNSAPAPTEQFNYQMPPTETVIPVVVEKPRNAGKYLLFLVLGLVLGGLSVLAAVLFSMYLNQNDPPPAVNQNSSANSAQTPKPTSTATPVTASAKHEKRTADADDEFNGRVITLNAYIRSSPNRNSRELDVLPIDDRLEIGERESDVSPWYQVTCEHGTTGWMHGNTIEYTNGF